MSRELRIVSTANTSISGPESPPPFVPNCSGITWNTKDGLKSPNYFGSLTQASTLRIGNFQGEEVYVPFKALLPMVEPNDIVFGGWDISGLNLAGKRLRAPMPPGSCVHPYSTPLHGGEPRKLLPPRPQCLETSHLIALM